MIKCFDNIFSRLIIISRCFRGGVMKAAADVLGDFLLLRRKITLREYILYYLCRIFTCFYSQGPQPKPTPKRSRQDLRLTQRSFMSKWVGQTDYNPYPKFESRSCLSCTLSKTVIRLVNVTNVFDIS